MKNYLLLGTAMLFTFAVAAEYDYKPYISTNMAKIIIEQQQTPNPDPQPDVEEGCDGSGWITHGDGHKTPCPGCGKCQNQSAAMETEYYVYHLGAEWCGPCKKLKRDVWADESLRKLMGDKSAKLYIFDVDDENDKKMFDFYKVRLYPTIIIVNKNTGEVLNRFEGFRTLDQMKDTIIGLGD